MLLLTTLKAAELEYAERKGGREIRLGISDTRNDADGKLYDTVCQLVAKEYVGYASERLEERGIMSGRSARIAV